MSNTNPNPEERERMVNASVRHLKTVRPDFFPKEPDDLDRLFDRAEQSIKTVKAQLGIDPESDQIRPLSIADVAITGGSLHTAEGSNAFISTAAKLFLDQFVQTGLDRDEALFLLAYTHAKMLRQGIA